VRPGSRGGRVDLNHTGAPRPIQLQPLGDLHVVLRIEFHPQVGALHAAVGQQLVDDPLHQVAGNAETNPFVAAAVGGDGGVDADDPALQVDQRAAAVAGIDGGVGL